MIPMMVSHFHINPEECCDCTCQKLRSHDLKNQVLDVDFSLQNFFGVYTRPEKFKWFTGENAEVCWTVRFSWDQFLCNLRFHATQGELASQ